MTQFSLYEAKTQLSKLVDRAAKGEDIVIAKNGEPAAVLVAPEEVRPRKREFGFLKCQVAVPSEMEWKELDAEVRRLFAKSARQKSDAAARHGRLQLVTSDSSFENCPGLRVLKV